MHDDVKTSILYFYSQDKDKNEYLLKASETYEPLNVNFVDLYQVKIYQDCPEMFQYFHNMNYSIQTQTASSSDSKGGLCQSFESGNKSSSSRAASSGLKLDTFHSLQCISWDSIATISSNFLSSLPHICLLTQL